MVALMLLLFANLYRGVMTFRSETQDQSLQLGSTDATRVHRKKQINDVLVGTWDTDSSWNVNSWDPFIGMPNEDYRVTITPLEAPTFLTGRDKHSHHYLAESGSFLDGQEGSQGSRVLTVRFVPFSENEKNATVGYLEERFDFFHPVHDYGRLKLETLNGELHWVIDWAEHISKGHRHSWLRKAGKASDSHAQSEDEVSQKIAVELLNEWDKTCATKLAIADATSLGFYINNGVTVGIGLRGGAWAEMETNVCLQFTWTERREERLKCLVEEMKSYSIELEESKDAFAESAVYHTVAQLMDKLLKPGLSSRCFPQFCLDFSFQMTLIPPFIWPVPQIGIEFLWPFSEIWSCGEQLNTTSEMQEAFAVRPQDEATKKIAQEMRSSALASERPPLLEGMSIGLFPPTLGWFIDTDSSVVINGRKLMQDLRRATDWVSTFGQRVRSKCDAKKESYFGSLSEFAKSAHQIYESNESNNDRCGVVRTRLDALKSQLPGLDFESNPLDYAKYLRQLSDPRYQIQDDNTYMGGFFYVGFDGIQTGIYHDPKISSKGGRKYRNDCKAFENMVNVYQSRLVHAQSDLMTDETCSLEPWMPSLKYSSCTSISEAEDFDSLPKFPVVLASLEGDVIFASDSQCTRCANVTSFGSPCEYCSSRLGKPTCSQHSTTSMCKIGGLVRSKFSEFDRPTDPRILCAQKGGKLSYTP